MIKNSFILLPGISVKGEENIWKQGIHNWDDFINAKKVKGISSSRKAYCDRYLKKAKKELHELNSSFFNMPAWRLYNYFKEETVFLDIEVEHVTKDVTVIGLFDGIDTKIMIKDKNLDFNILKEELKKYKLIVTYNGKVFDIPFLKKRYPDLIPNIPVFDLRSGCSKLNLKGGLKEVEKALGIERSNRIVKNLSSGDPYMLYKMWRNSGDEDYLKLLVEYNEEDVINLKKIADYVFSSKAIFLKKQYNLG